MYKPLTFFFLIFCVCLINLTRGQFFAKTSKSIPRMGRRSSPSKEVPLSSRIYAEPVKRESNNDYSRSELYNTLPIRSSENNYPDYLPLNNDNSERSNKLIELLRQLDAMNEIN